MTRCSRLSRASNNRSCALFWGSADLRRISWQSGRGSRDPSRCPGTESHSCLHSLRPWLRRLQRSETAFHGEIASAEHMRIHLWPRTQRCRLSEPPYRLSHNRRALACARPSSEDPGKAPRRSASGNLRQSPPRWLHARNPRRRALQTLSVLSGTVGRGLPGPGDREAPLRHAKVEQAQPEEAEREAVPPFRSS